MSNEILESDEWARVKSTIVEAEARTNAEIVVAVYPSCGRYDAVMMQMFVASALAAAICLWIYEQTVLWGPLGSWQSLFLPFVVGVASVVVFWPGPLRRLLVNKAVRRQKAVDAAKKHFFEQGLFETRQRNAVLVFVAKWERQIVVLGDKGIDAKVTPGYWDEAAARLAVAMQTKRFTDELCRFVSSLGGLLAQHFPRTPDDVNELPDTVQGASPS